MSLQLALLLGYSVAQVLLGIAIGRRVQTTSDFFVAGRRLGPGLLFSTLLAANIGAGSTVGAAGLGYRDGLSAWWWVGSAGAGSLVQALWIGPKLWREANRHGFKTVGDFLEHRYSPLVRGSVSLLLWFGTLAILAGQLVALAWMLNVVAGVEKPIGCAIGGLVMIGYFTAGGLLSSAWVNLVQLVVLLLGFALSLPLTLLRAGGVAAVRAAVEAPGYWSFLGEDGSGLAYLALLGPAFVVSPGLLQKIYGARDERTVRIGVTLNAAALFVFAAVPPWLGMIARSLHPDLAHHELALPTLLLDDLSPWVGSLGLAAVFSAEVSTCDAILFMLSTSLSQDLYRRFVNPAADDRQVLRMARVAALLGGLLGVLLAVLAPSVISVLTIFYTLLSVSLFVPVVAGLYTRRAGTLEAMAALVGGVGAVLALQLAGFRSAYRLLSPALVGLLVAAVAFAMAAFLRPTRRGAS